MEAMRLGWFLLLPVFLLICLVSSAHLTRAADIISVEQPLSGSKTIISKGGNFELGFFTPGQSGNYYIGIWYKKISVSTVVWVANRETPLPDTSSELKISEDGNLILVNQSKIPAWSCNSNSTASDRANSAILLDNGNLVLKNRLNSSLVIWQSFDHPTDTWLPEQKMGLNRVTGFRQRLISWRNSEDPAPGAYSFQIEANGTSQYFLQWNDSYKYWRSGEWDGQMFTLAPEATAKLKDHKVDRSEGGYVTNDKENYFLYVVKYGTIMRCVLEASGQLNCFIWSDATKKWNVFTSYPSDHCEVFVVCGTFGVCDSGRSILCECLPRFRPRSRKNWAMGDWAEGCAGEDDVICSDKNLANGKKVMFRRIPNMKLPLNPTSLIAEGVEECEAACLDHCSCSAYSYNSDGCFVWNGDLLNLRQLGDGDVNGTNLHVRVSADSRNAKKGVLALVIASCSIGLLASLVITSVSIWRCRRKLLVHATRTMDSLILFRYRDLRRATNDFAEKLGGGSFGSVFKGTLPDSSIIAVKKLEGLGQGEKQFKSEVSTIGKIQHVNLVRLRGFCSEGSERLLVYDFMPNGSLASHLFGVGQSFNVLSWKRRYEIAVGIAKGLAYLHEECRECILHCDIKPENILLDDEFCPKVADFGMAKLLGREFSRVLTSMRGTIGYLAPEWIQGVAITAKADVYSYGLMVLEIISGFRNSKKHEISGGDYFPLWAACKVKKGDVVCLLDPRLEGDVNVEELKRASRVACWCIQENESCRPSMGQVVLILEGILEVGEPPIPSFLQNLFAYGEASLNTSTEN